MCSTQTKYLIPLNDSTHQYLWTEIKSDKIWYLGDIAISKTVNLIPTDTNQFLKIKFSEILFSKIQLFKNIFEKIQKIEKIFTRDLLPSAGARATSRPLYASVPGYCKVLFCFFIRVRIGNGYKLQILAFLLVSMMRSVGFIII